MVIDKDTTGLKDLGHAYEIESINSDGDLTIDLDKWLIVIGDLDCKGNLDCKGDLNCEGYLNCGEVSYARRALYFSKHRITYSSKDIKIGCKTKTKGDWVDWFKGEEEYETPRGSKEFKQIETAFKMEVIAQENDCFLRRD